MYILTKHQKLQVTSFNIAPDPQTPPDGFPVPSDISDVFFDVFKMLLSDGHFIHKASHVITWIEALPPCLSDDGD